MAETTTREQVERAAVYYTSHASGPNQSGQQDRYVTTPDGTKWIVWRSVPVTSHQDGTCTWRGHTVRAKGRVFVDISGDYRDTFARLLEAAAAVSSEEERHG